MRKLKNVLLLFMLVTFTAFAFGQTTVTGTVTDKSNGESLPGVTVVVKGTSVGAATGMDGKYTINVPEGGKFLVFSYLGMETQEVAVSGATVNVEMVVGSAEIAEIFILADRAKDRKTPVAFSMVESETIELRVGNQEFPEIMKTTPSVYTTKSGGGYGDARINLRGFDQRNIAVMINGIPVNDMENGWVYWSNWAGLANVSNSIQIQRGLGASKLAIPSVGGSINIVTNAAQMKKGGSVYANHGNDLFQKYGLSYSTGLLDNGWAFSVQGTHTFGNGYIDGTQFKAWSYFGGISKVFNKKHTLSLTGLGAPQWHNQRDNSSYYPVDLQTFQDEGIKYNYAAGELDGGEYSWRKNFYHKPKVFLNHYFTISSKTELKTSAYISFGRGGGTGPRGRINNGGDRFYDTDIRLRDATGVRFDDIVDYNQGIDIGDADWGVKDAEIGGPFDGQYVATSSGSGFIRRSSMNSHNWYGILSTLSHKLSDNFTLTAGIDGRYYKGEHYRKLEDLLGLDAYLSRSDMNNPENYITDPDASIEDGNVLGYYNDGLVQWAGLFTQIEYSNNGLTAFLSASGSNQGFKRVDYFNYLDSDPEQTSDWERYYGGTVKAGANYNIGYHHNIFVNGGYISRQPIFDNVFINYVNDVNDDAKNQTITAVEIGYGFRTAKFKGNINLYRTEWANRQFDRGMDYEYPDGTLVDALVVFENITQLHKGIEIDFNYKPIEMLTVRGMVTLGDWKYKDNFTGNITDIDNNVAVGEQTMYMDGIKVGDAAQTILNLGFEIRPFKGFQLYASYSYFDNLYANFSINESQFYEANPTILKIHPYELVDAGFSYRYNFGKYRVTFKFNMNNLLDEDYVAEMFTNRADYMTNQGYYGFGRTWNIGLKFDF